MTTETQYPDTMQTIRDTLVARGSLDEEAIDRFLTEDGEDDEAIEAYCTYIAPAVDAIEEAIEAKGASDAG